MSATKLLGRLARAALLVATIALIGAGTAPAQDIFVDTDGNDGFNGQFASFQGGTDGPVRTIERAIELAADGDVIQIEAGNYTATTTGYDDSDGFVVDVPNLSFVVDPDGTFESVEVHGFTIAAAGIEMATGAGGNFEILAPGAMADPAVDLESGSLTIGDANLVLPAGVWVERTEASLTGEPQFGGELNLVYNGSNSINATGELPANLGGGELYVLFENDADAPYTLTLEAVSVGDVVEVNGASDIEGTLNVSGTTTITGPGNAGTLNIVGGTVNFATNPEADDVAIANNAGITVTIPDGVTLFVEGDFVRSGGAFQGNGELQFTGASADATFSAGPNFSVDELTVDKEGQTLSVTQSVGINDALTIMDGTVQLGSNVFNINGTGAAVINDGQLGTLGGSGGLVYNATGSLAGSGDFGNITNLSGGDIDVNGEVGFAGILALATGGIDASGEGDDISPTGNEAEVQVAVTDAGIGITGSFNADEVDYDLIYQGNIDNAGFTVGQEFATENIRNLTFNVSDGTIDASGAGGGTIGGDVDLMAAVDNPYTVLFPADVTVQGSLDIGQGATLDGTLVTLEGSTNMVAGVVDASTEIELSDGVTLTGSTVDDPDGDLGNAEVGPITVLADASATISNVQEINGDVTTMSGSSLQIGLVDERRVTGMLDLNGNMFTLASRVNVQNGVDISDGTLAFQSNNLWVNGGTFVGAGDNGVDVNYTGTGALVLNGATSFGTNGEVLPNVTVRVDVNLSSDTVIEGALVQHEVDDSILAGGNNLTVRGSLDIAGGYVFGAPAGGDLITVSATASVDGDASISSLIVQEGLDVSSADSEESHTLTILGVGGGDVLEVESGELNVGPNITLVTQVGIDLAGGDVTGGGWLVIDVGDIDLMAAGSSINNLAVDNDVTVTEDGDNDRTLVIDNALDLRSGDLDVLESVLEISDEATIMRSAGQLAITDDEDDEEGAINLGNDLTIVYGTESGDGEAFEPIQTGRELPMTALNITVYDAINLDQDVTVDGLLMVADPITSIDGPDDGTEINENITLAADSELQLTGDGNIGTSVEFEGGYALTFTDFGAADIPTNAFPDGATITVLTIDDDDELDFIAQEDRTIIDLVLAGGTFNLEGHDLALEGDMDWGSTLANTGEVSSVNLVFNGDGTQMLDVDADGTDGDRDVPNNIDVWLTKPGVSQVQLTGADLDFSANDQDLVFNGGLLVTGNDQAVVLFQGSVQSGGSLNADQGYVKVESNSYVVGNVRKMIRNDPGSGEFAGRVTYPLGDTLGNFSPLDFVFPTETGAGTLFQTNVTASFVTQDPQGSGLPIETDGLTVSDHPNFYWDVVASDDLSSNVMYTVEAAAEGFDLASAETIDNLRLLRRQEGNPSNPWTIAGQSYDNFNSDQLVEEETIPVVVAQEASLGLRRSGSIFTYGTGTGGGEVGDLAISGTVVYGGGEGAEGVSGANVTATATATDSLWASAVTNAEGVFSLDSLADGTYDVEATIDSAAVASGISAADALEVLRAAVGLVELTDVQTEVADVNDDGSINAVDALLIAQRAVNPDFEFEAGTFFVTSESVTVSGTNEEGVQLVVTAYGDVNQGGGVSAGTNGKVASATARGLAAFEVASLNARSVAAGSTFEVPVRVAQGVELGAFTLQIGYPAEQVSFEGIAGAPKGVVSHEADGSVSLAWFDATAKTPLAFGADEAVVTLRFAAAETASGLVEFDFHGELASAKAEVIDAGLNVDAIELGALPEKFALHGNYPNPFNPTTTISFDLPEDAQVSLDVVDVMGRRVLTVPTKQYEAGAKQSINIDASELASGLYVYRLVAEMNSERRVETGKMTLVK